MVVMSSTASVRIRTWFSQASRKTSIFSCATFERGLAASMRAALITCGQRFSIWAAAYLTIFTPSSLPDMLHAKFATSTSLLACSVNTSAYSSTSFSLPALAASINTRRGTFVSKKLSDTWSTTAFRSWRRRSRVLRHMWSRARSNPSLCSLVPTLDMYSDSRSCRAWRTALHSATILSRLSSRVQDESAISAAPLMILSSRSSSDGRVRTSL